MTLESTTHERNSLMTINQSVMSLSLLSRLEIWRIFFFFPFPSLDNTGRRKQNVYIQMSSWKDSARVTIRNAPAYVLISMCHVKPKTKERERKKNVKTTISSIFLFVDQIRTTMWVFWSCRSVNAAFTI